MIQVPKSGSVFAGKEESSIRESTSKQSLKLFNVTVLTLSEMTKIPLTKKC